MEEKSKILTELEDVGIDTIKILRDFIEKGIDFVQEQSPELCEQIISRELFQYYFSCIIFLILSISFGIVSYMCYKCIDKEDFGKEDNIPSVIFSVVFFLATLASFLGGCGSRLYYIGSIYVAPKVFLVEYFTKFIKGI